MTPYNPHIHHRRSIRLKGYDYSEAGMYFITLCCQDRACLFREIENGGDQLLRVNGQLLIINETAANNHTPLTIYNEQV